MQACSVLHVAHVGVRRVTVVIVHIGLEEVVVVIYFCVAIFVRDFLYQEMFSLHYGRELPTRNLGSYRGQDAVGIRRERMPYFPCNDSIVQG